MSIPLVVLVASGALGALPEEQALIDIGTRLELFVDRHLIDELHGAELQMHHPLPAETALAFDKPWEGRYCGYVTVIKDAEVYRAYYRGLPMAGADGSAAETTCYAESTDGITFTKPNLGLFEVNGTRENNVILANAAPLSHNFAPLLDTRPQVPPEQRYKALAGTSASGLVAFASPDGLHWTKLHEGPVITEGAFDSQNVAFWSESEGCYVCYFRTWDGYRTISRVTSPDFVNWSAPVPMTYRDTPREHLYTNQTRPYFRAPHIYLAVSARFMPGRRVVTAAQSTQLGGDAGYSGDCSDTVLMTSRGGSVYDRTFMEGFVRPGLGLTNWTSRTNYPACGVVAISEEEMAIYVQRDYGRPTQYLQRLKLRTDGFVSLNAPYAGGECRTKPLEFSGKQLTINYATSAAGSVCVEIQDQAGTPIPGFAQADADEIIGDEIARLVSWQGNTDVAPLARRAVRLRFILKDADLYSFQFHE